MSEDRIDVPAPEGKDRNITRIYFIRCGAFVKIGRGDDIKARGNCVLDCTSDSSEGLAQLASCPSPDIKPIPYGLVSLWDMINFNLSKFVHSLAFIKDFKKAAEAKAKEDPEAIIDEQAAAGFRETFSLVRKPFDALGIAEDRLEAIELLLNYDGHYRELAHECKALESDIMAASHRQFFYHYQPNKGVLVARVREDWAATLAAFPSAEEDVMAAVDCYALGHHRASIYHSMMVLERGLPAFAKRLEVKVRPKRDSWGPIIDDIRKEIDARLSQRAQPAKGSKPISARAAKARTSFLEACQLAAIEFRYFADIWRNHIAHGRGDYDENDAKKVLSHVRSYMETISNGLGLKEETKT